MDCVIPIQTQFMGYDECARTCAGCQDSNLSFAHNCELQSTCCRGEVARKIVPGVFACITQQCSGSPGVAQKSWEYFLQTCAYSGNTVDEDMTPIGYEYKDMAKASSTKTSTSPSTTTAFTGKQTSSSPSATRATTDQQTSSSSFANPTHTPQPSPTNEGSTNLTAIIVPSVLAPVVLVLLALFFFRKRIQRCLQKKPRSPSDVETIVVAGDTTDGKHAEIITTSTTRSHQDYQIGIICALAIEKAAMEAMLDQRHAPLANERHKDDDNEYTLGKIGSHNVIIASLPAGSMGNSPATEVAINMKRSFPIKFGLMVGVGGGVWSEKDDVRLGDVVVSQPAGLHGGVVQWDFGKTVAGGEFQRTGSLAKPPVALLQALQKLKTYQYMVGIDLNHSLKLMGNQYPKMKEICRYQGSENDGLYEAAYDHANDNETCQFCDRSRIVKRPRRKDNNPVIHYGNIASGNEVMKHGTTRDAIAKAEGVICFEMEAAGLMDNFRCLVVRGICDYADSHKNKIWQPYAAATAAALAREILYFIEV